VTVERQGRSEVEPQELGHPVCDGDLAGARRVAALAEREDSERVLRILCAEVHGLDAAGDADRAMGNDVDRPERFPGPGEARLELPRIGAVELKVDVGRAELGVGRRSRVVDDRDAADRRRDRDGEEGQHQDLLSPLAAEQAERPADHRAARGDTAPLGSGQRRWM
jgi:hypothetical protein